MLRLKEIRKKSRRTQQEVANFIGITQSNYSYWEKEKVKINNESLKKLANYFNVTVDYLLGDQENDQDKRIIEIGGFQVPDKYLIPVVGQVVAGKPIESPEYIEGYVYIEKKNAQDFFALRVSGDSMINAGIVPGSLLIVHKQNTAINGDIIVASIDGESTVKRFKENNGAIFLMPENSAYSPILITEKTNFYIFGKVVEIRVSL